MNRTKCVAMAACMAVLAVAFVGAGEARQKIQVGDLNSKYDVVGSLGTSLGAYHTIEGVRIQDDRKVNELLIKVDTVDGKKLAAPLTIPVIDMDRPEVGARCVIRGYESCAWEGMYEDPQDPIPVQTMGPGFYSWFRVTKVLSGGPAAK